MFRNRSELPNNLLLATPSLVPPLPIVLHIFSQVVEACVVIAAVHLGLHLPGLHYWKTCCQSVWVSTQWPA